MQKYATFDATQFPVVVVTFTGVAATDDNFEAYLNQLHDAYERETPFAYLFDAGEAVLPGLKYQRMQAQWLKDHRKLMQSYCRGTAYHIPNPIIRTALKGIFAFQQQPVPYKIAGSFEEALQWCKNQAEEVS